MVFLASIWLVSEIRTSRSLNCFGCTNVKCVLREVDQRPVMAVTHPLDVLKEF